MADNSTKAIADIEPGDIVWATNPETGDKEAREVTNIHINIDFALADVTVKTADGRAHVIRTTPNHRFWDDSTGRWQKARALTERTVVRTADGSRASIGRVVPHGGLRRMYNLTVDHIHTYYVLADNTPVLVHNCGDLVGDATRFPNAHVLNEHVNVSDAQLVQMAQANGVKSRFHDLQTAQQVVDYGLAGNQAKISRWLRGGGVGNLEINGRFGVNNPIGVVARADGSISPSSNAYTIILQRAQGHPGGYYVYTAYPR